MTDHVKQGTRSAVDAISQAILNVPSLERLVVGMLRRHPRGRLSLFVCQSLRRAAARCEKPYRMTTIEGIAQLRVDLSDFLGALYLCGDRYEPESTTIFKALVGEGDVVFDIGANAGFYTLIAAGLAGPNGAVHAFEPNPKLLEGLKESVAASGFQGRVMANELAVADSCREGQKLYVSTCPTNSGLSSLFLYSEAAKQGNLRDDACIDVDTVTFDAYVQEKGIQQCGLVKIDVETGETAVVRGMQKSLAAALPRYILCETAVDGDADRAIRSHGYRGFMPTELDEFYFEGKARTFGNLFYLAPGVELPPALRSIPLREIADPDTLTRAGA